MKTSEKIGEATPGIRPLYRELPYEEPCEVYERLRSPAGFLFESVRGSAQTARYSFIGIDPYLTFKVKDGGVGIEQRGKRSFSYRNPLDRLRELVGCYRQEPIEGLPPFQGGAAGMLSYDFVRYLEKIPASAVDDLRLPDAHFFMFDKVVAFDHSARRCWVLVCPGARHTVLGYGGSGLSSDSWEEVDRELQDLCDRVAARRPSQVPIKRAFHPLALRHETDKNTYMSMVKRAKEYIAAGDIFQANLSLRVSAGAGAADPWQIYRVLREINPSPFSSFMDFGDYQIVGSSPERLVRVRGKEIDTRPIAGTRPRGGTPGEDSAMRSQLLLNPKERAEHIMLIDLERNDLGRVSDYGSVQVDELMVTEDYSHVIHIVSNVRGRLAEGKDCFDVIKAVFPGGTITGVPKVRCMEIIEELEPVRRGSYTGSMGYIGFNGNMDLNIIIRTFLIKEGRAYIQAGAGIVADSEPEREYYESLKKAEALIRTLERL